MLCCRLRTLFEIPSNATRNASKQPLDDLELECFSEPGEMDDPRPRLLRIHFRVKFSATVFREILIIPDTIARRVDAERPDFAVVKKAIDQCRTKHKCSSGTYYLPDNLSVKAIDCSRKTLCHISPRTQYACLSYVWGRFPVIDNDTSTDLEQIPKTIDDAIQVTSQLGIQYLWVDRYCIDQNNDLEKHLLIQNMDSIYHRATVTIVAASGNSPSEGLLGINGTPRTP
ncbi:hypothetical protein EK21DRAFT_117909 [Setomelanomma holmii]|uniref:Heterokaryon incompatibility domain-containing protein n=1 Tax=Setomelanomma holmii TaxID=210430 RepID=A0A9P4LHM7_9PLEO|nr:hypothetical protein EK21DRAFT_117909 [Setomelanomma holmii]